MRSFGRLAAAAALLTILGGLVALALNIGTSGGRAVAIAPTPAPWAVDWRIEVPEQAVAGSTLHLFAEAILMAGPAPSSPALDPSYHLAVRGDDAPVELRSPASVLPADVSDGAEWELFGLRGGEATLEISLTYRQSWCYPCDTRSTTETTTRVVAITALYGDVDCSLTADSIDAALLLQLVAALVDELSCQDGADVNQDGNVNTLDAALILQFVAGLLDSLPL